MFSPEAKEAITARVSSLTCVCVCVCVSTVQGLRDLFWLPVEQYRKDGRIVRGLQRGANSFMTCTTMSMLELTNRIIQTVQVCSTALAG